MLLHLQFIPKSAKGFHSKVVHFWTKSLSIIFNKIILVLQVIVDADATNEKSSF